MKFKMLAIFLVFASIFLLYSGAQAQYMTQDLIFIKAGYVPVYTVTFEDKEDRNDGEMAGFVAQGEYNLNLGSFWMGFGLEFQRMEDEADNSEDKDRVYSFLIPMVSLKLAATGGFYLGAGVAGKYLIAADKLSDETEFKKDIDLWANGIFGYHTPIGEGVFLDFEGRFGWNITNRQFSEVETNTDSIELETKSAYDISFYLGIGFRAPGSYY